MNVDVQGLRHLQALRSFIGNLVDQAERAGGCDCHKPPSLLLVGPPGAGKTYLVKQMSNVCEMPLYGVHTNQVRGPAAVRKLFEQARDNYPSLVFMDDVDAILSDQEDDAGCSQNVQGIRDELFTQLGPRKLKIRDPKSAKNPTDSTLGRTGVNGAGGSSRASSRASSATIPRPPRPSAPPDEEEDDEDVFDENSPYPDNNGIIVVAATSTPWFLYKDHELLSRFRGVYLVGLPDKQTRYHLLQSLLRDVHHNLSDKDIMVVAEKTEGFTPADLMVVVKTLTYRQFSFLLSMASARGASVGSSSDVASSGSQTPLSSEISEASSESDLDGLPESEGHLKQDVATAAAVAAATAAAAKLLCPSTSPASGAVPKKDLTTKTTGAPTRKKTPPKAAPPTTSAVAGVGVGAGVAAAATVVVAAAALESEWDSDSEEGECHLSPESQRDQVTGEQVPTRVTEETEGGGKRRVEEPSVPSPDSAIGLSQADETGHDAPHPPCEAGLEGLAAPTPLRTPSESSGVASSGCDSSDSSAIVEEGGRVGGEVVGDERRHHQPSSDSEDEGEAVPAQPHPEVEEERTREVEEVEVEVAAMDSTVREVEEEAEAEVECEVEGLCDSVDGEEGSFELHYTEPPDPMRDDNCAIDSDSDNELSEGPRGRGGAGGRRVAFSGMGGALEPLSVDVGDGCGPPNVSLDDLPPPNISLAAPEPLLNNQDGAGGSGGILLSLLARPSPATPRPAGLSFLDNDLDSNKASTPIEEPSLGPPITPTPSEGSSNGGTVGSSGSGARVSAGSTSSEVHKKEDSDSSFDHSDVHTVPSSDISTATCNETGETMECRTDSEERLRELEDGQASLHSSDTYQAPDEDKTDGQNSLLNLDNLNEIRIQLITLADVLEVVNKGYRSVSDEEIKRYTDFMVWFSSVAKSACPHSKDGSHRPNAPHLDDISVDSTLYDTPSIAKKRKGPLRKLGRFLLKALMFILD